MRRRSMLRQFGAVGGAVFATGCTQLEDLRPDPVVPDGTHAESPISPGTTATESPQPTAIEPPHADRFGTVIDLSAAGADTQGTRSIVPLLEEHLGDDTLVYLPAGEYLMDEGIHLARFENLGIVGDGAVIVPPDGFSSVFFDLGRPGEASGLVFDGLTFDFRAPETGSRPLAAHVDDELLIRNLAVSGRQDAGWGMLRVDVTNPDGVGRVVGLRLPDGATADTNSNGCLVGDMHRGEAWFEDCYIEGFPDNGLYGSPDIGTVHVRGGYYANCGISSLRVGNAATVVGAHVRCDAAPDGFDNMRGIRLRRGGDVEVRDCLVEMLEVTSSDGGITLASAFESAAIRDTEIRVDADDVNAIRAKHPDADTPRDGLITIENVTISGSASGTAAVDVNARENCEFDSIIIDQDGSDRDGIAFSNGSRATVRNSQITVSGRPVITSDGSTVQLVNDQPDGSSSE